VLEIQTNDVDCEAVKVLPIACAEVSATGKYDCSALFGAVAWGHLAVIQILASGANISQDHQ
jgi:hypothetical protein